jgi:cytochrome c oxidase subunit 2
MTLKADAAPGRLNRLNTTPDQVGLFYGQCSEICGVNHRFMPIAVEVTGGGAFSAWLVSSA